MRRELQELALFKTLPRASSRCSFKLPYYKRTGETNVLKAMFKSQVSLLGVSNGFSFLLRVPNNFFGVQTDCWDNS